MVEVQAAVSRWITEQKQVADAVVVEAHRTLEMDKENVSQLQDELDAIDTAQDALQHQAAEERQRTEKLRHDLDQLAMQESNLPPEQQRLQSQLEQQQALVEQRERACERLLHSKNLKLDELQKGSKLYSARLGLAFEQMGGERLRLIFTDLDQHAPSRQFSFHVFVDGNDKYHIEQCNPAVPALDQLLDALNEANNFSSFVRAMRKEFKKMC
ncbi:hypothetical protein AB1Y20_002546 [Prymnesium parvum]|uniref:Kinetochore protein SPC25 n=1 Tax=Prymnesium parvum TaxID=97485 RepID=A0AB34J8W5_PRYPA